jgi:hypothetical protein
MPPLILLQEGRFHLIQPPKAVRFLGLIIEKTYWMKKFGEMGFEDI